MRWLSILALGLLTALAQGDDTKEKERQAKFDKEVATVAKKISDHKVAPGGVLFLGSSSIRLWKLDQAFPGKAYPNAGFGGSQIRDSLHFYDQLVKPVAPGTIVFYAGDNDINAGRKPDDLVKDYQSLTDKIHADFPKTTIYFIAIKPSISRWKQFDTQTQANAAIKALGEKNTRLKYIDIVPTMLGSDGKPKPELFVDDGLHLSPQGYELWKDLVEKVINKRD